MKTVHKDEFFKLLSRIRLKQLFDCIMGVRGYELGTSLIQNRPTRWIVLRGKKNAGILQNEDCGYFGSQKAQMRTVEMYQS